MKRLLTFLFIVFCWHNSIAQDVPMMPIDSTTGLITYQGVVNIDGETTQSLYLRGKEWFTRSFGSGKAVIDFDDNVNFKIVGKGQLPVWISGLGRLDGGSVHFTATLLFKEGKYKYVFTNFSHYGTGVSSIPNGGPLEIEKQKNAMYNNLASQNNWNKVKKQTDDKMKSLEKSLIGFMSQKTFTTDW